MAWMIFIAASLVAAGIGAGFFLGVVPIVIFSVIGIIIVLLPFLGNDKNVGGGTSGGIGLAFIALATLLFLIPMWATAIAVRLGGASLSVDWSSTGQWLRDVFLR